MVPAPAAVTVTVLNSTDKTGLAAQVTGFLATDGFKTGTPANDTHRRAPVTGVAEIRYGPAGAAGGQAGVVLRPGRDAGARRAATDATVDLALGAKYTAVASTDRRRQGAGRGQAQPAARRRRHRRRPPSARLVRASTVAEAVDLRRRRAPRPHRRRDDVELGVARSSVLASSSTRSASSSVEQAEQVRRQAAARRRRRSARRPAVRAARS